MLSNALFWSGHQLCWALTNVGIDESSLTVCNENQRVMGFLIVAWAAVMIIIWKLMVGRIK